MMKAKVQSGIPSLLSEDAALWRVEGITGSSSHWYYSEKLTSANPSSATGAASVALKSRIS